MNHILLSPRKSYHSIFDTNVLGSFLLLRECAKQMTRQKTGRIVNFSSVAAPLDLEGEVVFANLLTKMLMTGALVIASPGSPVQLLSATLVMMGFMLLVLKTSPFVADGEDVMSFLSTLALVLTSLGGLVLIMDQRATDDEGNPAPTFDADTIGMGLVVMNTLVILAQLVYIILVKTKVWGRIARRIPPCARRPRSLAKVQPKCEGEARVERVEAVAVRRRRQHVANERRRRGPVELHCEW